MRALVIGAWLMAVAIASAHAEERKDIFVAGSLGFSIEPLVPAGNGTYQVAAFFLPEEKGFSGNVNVQRQEFPDSIAAYDRLSMGQFAQLGLKVIRREQRNGEYVYEYTGNMQGRALHWYARAVSAPPHVYLVTATTLEASWARQKALLMRSVDSFARR